MKYPFILRRRLTSAQPKLRPAGPAAATRSARSARASLPIEKALHLGAKANFGAAEVKGRRPGRITMAVRHHGETRFAAAEAKARQVPTGAAIRTATAMTSTAGQANASSLTGWAGREARLQAIHAGTSSAGAVTISRRANRRQHPSTGGTIPGRARPSRRYPATNTRIFSCRTGTGALTTRPLPAAKRLPGPTHLIRTPTLCEQAFPPARTSATRKSGKDHRGGATPRPVPSGGRAAPPL
mgnify:CR=1 FL=1